MQHFRDLHWDYSFTCGLSSPSQLGSRVYQAHMVYTLCRAYLAPTIPMEDQDSDHYCEAAALAADMMRSSGCNNE